VKTAHWRSPTRDLWDRRGKKSSYFRCMWVKETNQKHWVSL